MLALQSQTTQEGSQPLFRNVICETIFGRRLGYSKGLGWEPRPKSRKSSGSSSQTTFSHSTAVEEANAILIEQQRLEIQETRRMIEEQRKFSEMPSRQMEEMMKKIEELSLTHGGS